jgi:hypothetical protein
VTDSQGRWPRPEPNIEDAALLILEWLGEQGIHAMLRIDADRVAEHRPAWTFAASGGPITTGIRADGPSPRACLTAAVIKLRDLGVEVPDDLFRARM